jgi:hypothetical protein
VARRHRGVSADSLDTRGIGRPTWLGRLPNPSRASSCGHPDPSARRHQRQRRRRSLTRFRQDTRCINMRTERFERVHDHAAIRMPRTPAGRSAAGDPVVRDCRVITRLRAPNGRVFLIMVRA